VKPQPLWQKLLLKTLNFTLLLVTVVSGLSPAADASPASPPDPKTPPASSKSSGAVSSPAKQSGIKSSKNASTRKKTASRTKKSRRTMVRGQRTIESARVIEIQNALAAAGYYKETPSGQWDDSTSKAMSAYQQHNGFRATGKPDALSLKKLGL
jgi:Putative peptidoglycan binding domain